MKLKVTEKKIKENFPEIMKVGACKLSCILNHFAPQYYTCNNYGWKADVYIIDDMVIVTGYKAFGTFRPDEKELERVNREYEQLYAENLPYEKEVERCKELLKSLYK